MKFLVTGATSGLGRNAVQWLLENGHQVNATGRDMQVGSELVLLGAQFTALDLVTATDEDYRQLMVGCDAVWHCAAFSSPWGSKKAFYEANVLVSVKLATITGKMDIKRFVHISTPSIYFDFQSHSNITEDYLASAFANEYAKTKYQAELDILKQSKIYPNTVYIILRPRGLFGPYDRVIVPRILAQIERTKGILPLPGGGLACVDLTFVLNVVHAMYLATVNKELVSGEAFNISNHQPVQLVQVLAQLLKEELGINYKVRKLPYVMLYIVANVLEKIAKVTGKEPALTRYSIGALYFDMTLSQHKASTVLGYQPQYTLEEGIVLTAKWLKEQGMKHNG
ncbi:NAD-dependent epimerase/dehydratase family protein [Neisseria sp. Ec49-e6-T10]|uniref:NAD-dependent epimerase/dehydratase family protein n=1 Tax=Neisseria sp. Ec49-e6-T10 TaxID=3140744 RepID=UPI003EC12367